MRRGTVVLAVALVATGCSSSGRNTVIFDTGRIGPLKVDRSSATDVIAYAGSPDVDVGGVEYGGTPYRALGYDCSREPSDDLFPVLETPAGRKARAFLQDRVLDQLANPQAGRRVYELEPLLRRAWRLHRNEDGVGGAAPAREGCRGLRRGDLPRWAARNRHGCTRRRVHRFLLELRIRDVRLGEEDVHVSGHAARDRMDRVGDLDALLLEQVRELAHVVLGLRDREAVAGDEDDLVGVGEHDRDVLRRGGADAPAVARRGSLRRPGRDLAESAEEDVRNRAVHRPAHEECQQ